MGDREHDTSRAGESGPPLLWLAVIAALGAAAIVLCTGRGLMVNVDSAIYMGAARSLSAGQGYRMEVFAGESKPLTRFPPLTSVVLAAPAALGLDLLTAGRWLDALLLAGSAMLVGWLVYRHTGERALAVLGAALAATGSPMIAMHTALLSEPLFVFLVLLGILLLDGHLRGPRTSLLLGSAAAFALALLTRWPAAPFIGAGGLVILLWGRGKVARRLWEAVLFGVVAALPTALWTVRNMTVGGSVAERRFVFHPLTAGRLNQGLTTVASWVMPRAWARAAWGRWFVPAALVGLTVWGCVLLRRARADRSDGPPGAVRRPPYLLLAVSVAYLAFLAVSLSFFDAMTPLSDRILIPVYLTGVVLVLWLAKLIVVSVCREPRRRAAIFGICAVCALVAVPQGVNHFVKRSRDGAGYTRRGWRESPTLEAALAMARSVPVYANDAAAFYVLGGVLAHRVPRAVDPVSTLPNPSYRDDMASMVKDAREHGAVIVLFRDHKARQAAPPQELHMHGATMELLHGFPDGAIYGIVPPAAGARSSAATSKRPR